jgi:signal peptidase II
MKKKDWFWVLTSLFGVIFIDQVSKYYVLGAVPKIHWEYFHISLHFNKGAMLGLFADLPPVLRIVSLSTGGAFLLFSFCIFQYLIPTRSMILRVGMSILIAGILGNVIDRTIWGYVIDFIILGNRDLSTGVFNLADLLQWFGYSLMGYALFKDKDNLWPKNNLRKDAWVDPKFQLRYCYILVACGLGFSLVSGVFSYTFLRFVVIDLIGKNEKLLDQFLIPFLVTFSAVSVGFSAFLFMIGKQLSHRIVGPVYAFERFVNDYINGGNEKTLKLRKGDEFLQLEELSVKISEQLRVSVDSQVIPILPEGLETKEEIQQEEIS